MKDEFFVGIYDPVDVRRNILEASKEIVRCLQSYEALKSIREEKLRQYKVMRGIMAELDLLMSRFETSLPRSQLRKAPLTKQEVMKTPLASPDIKVARELEKLGKELKQVEKELMSLQ